MDATLSIFRPGADPLVYSLSTETAFGFIQAVQDFFEERDHDFFGLSVRKGDRVEKHLVNRSVSFSCEGSRELDVSRCHELMDVMAESLDELGLVAFSESMEPLGLEDIK